MARNIMNRVIFGGIVLIALCYFVIMLLGWKLFRTGDNENLINTQNQKPTGKEKEQTTYQDKGFLR